MIIKQISDFEQVKSFYKIHYDNSSTYLMPNQENNYQYLALCNDQGEVFAMIGLEFAYGKVAILWQLVVHTNYRGRGIASRLLDKIEPYLKVKGYIKMLGYIYTNNLPSLFLSLKKGFLVEGLMRDNDAEGSHVYTLGKSLL